MAANAEKCSCFFLLESGVVSTSTWHERAIYRKLRKELSPTVSAESLRMSVGTHGSVVTRRASFVTPQTQDWRPGMDSDRNRQLLGVGGGT